MQPILSESETFSISFYVCHQLEINLEFDVDSSPLWSTAVLLIGMILGQKQLFTQLPQNSFMRLMIYL